jgi:predicted Zn-dependent protease with MMP-like domain/Flp pilus assembly protein TadD
VRRPEPDGSPEADRLADAAEALFDAEEFDAALARADEALALAPRSVAAHHLRAAALAELGRADDAREAYERALELGRDDLDLLHGAADFYVNVLQDDEGDREWLERGHALARRGFKLARRERDRELEGAFALLEAAALNGLGEAGAALARLEVAAERLPDARGPGPAVAVQLERGFALYELCRFDAAQAALLAAERGDPEDPWTQHHLGLVAERRGDEEEARRRFARARALAPDAFPKTIALGHDAFDAAVEAALAELPESVRRYLANVAITVEDLPSDDDLLASDPPLSPSILGLFRGAPYGQKVSMDPWSHFPSSIVLYQKNLERFARSRKDLVEQIGITLIHEVGHFLGLDEEELWERGLD